VRKAIAAGAAGSSPARSSIACDETPAAMTMLRYAARVARGTNDACSRCLTAPIVLDSSRTHACGLVRPGTFGCILPVDRPTPTGGAYAHEPSSPFRAPNCFAR
jgi:hypothetical protein